MNKTGYYYFAHLTTAQKIKFKENLRRNGNEIRDYFSKTRQCMHHFLGPAFIWGFTKQGHDYWSDIEKKFKNI